MNIHEVEVQNYFSGRLLCVYVCVCVAESFSVKVSYWEHHRIIGPIVNKHTHAYFMDYSPLLSLVVLALSLALVPSTSRSSVPGSD